MNSIALTHWGEAAVHHGVQDDIGNSPYPAPCTRRLPLGGPRQWVPGTGPGHMDRINRSKSLRHLITGGAGFIGSHLAEYLLAGGHRVHVLDDLSTGAMDNIRHLKGNPKFAYTIESAASRATIAELVDEADLIFHLAAAVGVELI